MARFIDADALIEVLKKQAENNAICGYMTAYDVTRDCIDTVEEQPTAFDVDAVIQQLDDRSTLSRPVGWSKAYEIITLKDAVEIVRNGGKE